MKHLKLISIVGIWVGLDLISKHFFYNLRYFEHTPIINPVLNQGISRSLPVPFLLILGVTIIGLAAILRLYKTKHI